MHKTLGYFFMALAVITVLTVLYINRTATAPSQTFSPYTLLSSSWEQYKKKFINQDGRVVDFSQNEITTSEGQSYAMLRAVWSDDKSTFDKTWQWTKDNLKRPNDNLYGWRWGKLENGTYDFQPGGGENSASDADTDIALALILAGRRWNDWRYIADAQVLLDDIWKINTDTAAGKRYLIAGNWAKNNTDIVVNPSYFSPYAWRIFAEVDKKHDWTSLLDPAYELLQKSSQSPLDKSMASGLPPDWISVSKATGDIKAVGMDNLTTNYSYDAIRIPWRIAVDYVWNKEPRAKAYLESSFSALSATYSQQGQLSASYSHDGKALTTFESPSMYATVIGYFIITDEKLAQRLYEEKIIKLYSNDKNQFNEDLPYYEQNWLWFGAALYNQQIIPYQ